MFKIKDSKAVQSKFLMSDQILKKLVSDDSLLFQIDREYDFSVVDEVEMLKNILEQNVFENEDNVLEKEDKRSRPIRSMVDADAMLGFKDEKKMVFGYKGNMSATTEGIITGVTISTMADRDDSQLVPLVEEQESVGLKAEKMNADSAYGFIQDFVNMEEKGIELHAPMRGSTEHDEISMYDFKYDDEKNVLICPEGVESKRVGSKMRFEFPIKKYWRCPKASVCCPGNRSRRFTLDENYELVMRLRRRNQSKEYKERNNERLQIETLFAFLEKLGVKRASYRGIDRVGIQLYITAITSNVVKTVRLKVKQEKEKIEGASKVIKNIFQLFSGTIKSFFQVFPL